MDELSLMEVPEPSSLTGVGTGGAFLFQQVAPLRDGLVRGVRWEDVAEETLQTVFAVADSADPGLRRLAELYADDLSAAVLDPVPACEKPY